MSSKLLFVVFLTSFLFLYGLLHAYVYWKIRQAPALRGFCHRLIIGSLLLLLVMPIATALFARYEGEFLAEVTGYIGYYWMGGIFLFFCIHVVIDLFVGAAVLLSGRRFSGTGALGLGKGLRLMAAVALVFAILIYGSFEARSLRVKRVEIRTGKLQGGRDRLRIVQISDIHFGPMNGIRIAKAIAERVNDLHPDVLVSTGDLIDRGIKGKDRVAQILAGVKAPLGKFAVTGNHEFYAGIPHAVWFTEAAGFRMLRNEFVTLEGDIAVAGVDDPAASRSGPHPDALEPAVLSGLSEGRLTVLLKHQPRVLSENPGRFDIQLSGHTHRGQIFPFGWVTAMVFPYHYGLYALESGKFLHVSAGTGTWGPPVRFLAPPEITVIDVERETTTASSPTR